MSRWAIKGKLIKKAQPHVFTTLLVLLSSSSRPLLLLLPSLPPFLSFLYFLPTISILYTIFCSSILPGPCFSSQILSQKTNQSNQGNLKPGRSQCFVSPNYDVWNIDFKLVIKKPKTQKETWIPPLPAERISDGKTCLKEGSIAAQQHRAIN